MLRYAEYMQSEAWFRRRETYYSTHARRCSGCETMEGIELHHLSYEHIYAEPDDELMPLCQRCHATVHQVHKIIGGSLAKATHQAIADLRRPTRRAKAMPVKAHGAAEPNSALFAAMREGQPIRYIPQRKARQRGIAALKLMRENGYDG